MSGSRLIFRAEAADVAHIATVADVMRASGIAFPTKTGAIKMALKWAAEKSTAQPKA